MAYYVVSYDLRNELSQSDYQRVHDALRTAMDYCWALQSFWIIGTDFLPSQIIQTLQSSGAIEDNDGIVVLEITSRGNYRRVASQPIADWLDGFLTKL